MQATQPPVSVPFRQAAAGRRLLVQIGAHFYADEPTQTNIDDQLQAAENVEAKQRRYHRDIAREFIRQYHTSLAQDRNNLYRFYSSESTLLHEGLFTSPKPITGQSAIKEQIQATNEDKFQIKINAFSVAESFNKSLLIHVVGTLMDTLKMRPFSQSILLMPQGAKKYYLHTDIFMFSPAPEDADDDDGPPQVTFGENTPAQPMMPTASLPPVAQTGNQQPTAHQPRLSPPPDEPRALQPNTPQLANYAEPPVYDKPPTAALPQRQRPQQQYLLAEPENVAHVGDVETIKQSPAEVPIVANEVKLATHSSATLLKAMPAKPDTPRKEEPVKPSAPPSSWAALVKQSKPNDETAPPTTKPVHVVPVDPMQQVTLMHTDIQHESLERDETVADDKHTGGTHPIAIRTTSTRATDSASLEGVRNFFIKFTQPPEGLTASRFAELCRDEFHVDLSMHIATNKLRVVAPRADSMNPRGPMNMMYVFLDLTDDEPAAERMRAVAKRAAGQPTAPHFLSFETIKNSAIIHENKQSERPANYPTARNRANFDGARGGGSNVSSRNAYSRGGDAPRRGGNARF